MYTHTYCNTCGDGGLGRLDQGRQGGASGMIREVQEGAGDQGDGCRVWVGKKSSNTPGVKTEKNY